LGETVLSETVLVGMLLGGAATSAPIRTLGRCPVLCRLRLIFPKILALLAWRIAPTDQSREFRQRIARRIAGGAAARHRISADGIEAAGIATAEIATAGRTKIILSHAFRLATLLPRYRSAFPRELRLPVLQHEEVTASRLAR
jgi:hypothetical protein